MEAISTISTEANLSLETIHFDPWPDDTLFRLNCFEPVNHIPLVDRIPFLSSHGNPSQMMRNLCQRWEYVEGAPLGKDGQGIAEPIQALPKLGREGLEYQEWETSASRVPSKPIGLSHFVSAGIIDPNQSGEALSTRT
jgi:hypothetical protein